MRFLLSSRDFPLIPITGSGPSDPYLAKTRCPGRTWESSSRCETLGSAGVGIAAWSDGKKMPNDLTFLFPRLDARNHRITSREDPGYNCVAWATRDSTRWWDHLYGYWPDGVARDSSVEAYVELFRELGFEKSNDSNPEFGFEKIALYAKNGEFTHVARLLESGHWTSKLGALEDIEHNSLDSLASDSYGRPLAFLRRPKGSRPRAPHGEPTRRTAERQR